MGEKKEREREENVGTLYKGLKRYMNQSQQVNLNWILIQTNYRQSMFCTVGSNFSYHSIINSELPHKV